MNNTNLVTLLLCIVGILIQPSLQSFVVLSNDSSTLFDEKCYNFKFLGPDLKVSINASYIAADPWDACSPLKNKEQYEGKIVVFGDLSCLPTEKVKHVQKAGAILAAMLLDAEYLYGLANARYDDSDGIDIPVVTIEPSTSERHDWIKSAAQGAPLTKSTDPSSYIAIVTPDHRPDNTDFWVFFSVIIGIYSCINAAFGGFRLYQILVSQGKFQATLPEICLILEVAANVERIIMCIDPDYATGWGIFPFSTNIVLQWLSLPWTFSATALIGAYWNRALNHFVQNTHESSNVFHIEKWKIPIAILCFFLIVWGTINAALQAYVVTGISDDIGEFIYIFVCIAVCFYFMVTGVRILLTVRKTTAVTKSTERLKKLAILVGVTGFGITLMFIGLICGAVNDDLWKINIFLTFLGINTMSLAKVVIFEATQKAKSSNTLSTHVSDNHRSTQLPEIESHKPVPEIQTV